MLRLEYLSRHLHMAGYCTHLDRSPRDSESRRLSLFPEFLTAKQEIPPIQSDLPFSFYRPFPTYKILHLM
jgi:hypothetical protein